MRDEDDFNAGKRGPVLKRRGKDGHSKGDLPVVCTLTPATVATRKAALLRGLVGRADIREETATGLRVTLPADALSAILETVDAERKCCRFLRFDIIVEPDGGPDLVGAHRSDRYAGVLSRVSRIVSTNLSAFVTGTFRRALVHDPRPRA